MRSSREPGRGTRDANRERRFELRVMRAKCVTIIYPLKSNASVRTRRETDRPRAKRATRIREPAQYRCPNFSFSLKFCAYLIQRNDPRAFSSVTHPVAKQSRSDIPSRL